MLIMEKNSKKFKSKKNTFKYNKGRKSKLKSEDEIIRNIKEAYANIDSSNISRFTDFPLSPKTLKGLKECGYISPTEIQRESIGLSLRGQDILGAAKTGSGKTLAFIIPILEILYCQQWTRLDGVGALVITPTRELAYQIFETLRRVGTYHDVSAGLIIGGKDLQFEKKRMDQCNIVICTPGRLLQHMDENPLFDCSNMKILVLDEADRCLDLGFEATMNNIIENLPPKRQTLLFSATQTKSVRDLARLSLKDPMYVSVHEHAKHSTPESLQQSYVVCELHEKMNMLWSFIRSHLKQKTLVFMSTCKQVKYFYELFCRLRPGTSLMALYGTLHQLRRMAIYESFCRKSNAILFATDIAARGLDFPEVNWVVQLDCPEDANTYIHRAGRTARYQKGGESLLVLMPSEEEAMVEQLEAKKIPIKKIKINPMKLQNPLVKIDGLLARDSNLKESAQRAFVSYAKSVYLMGDKKIFNVNALDFNAYSRSLGLAIPPRIRFLQKVKKQEELRMSKEKKINQTASDEENETDIEENETLREDVKDRFSEYSQHEVKNSASKLEYFNFNNEDSDSDDDILKIKRKDHDLAPEESSIELLPENIKQKKAVTKVAVARKILKKKIVPNKKTVFNEDGEAVVNNTKEKVSTLARKYESEIGGGIDIEVAKQILKEEDIFDKQRFREKVKAERRMKKMQMKKAKNKEMDEEKDQFMSDGSDEDSLPDLSWLPDPDKIYQSNDATDKSDDAQDNSDDTGDNSDDDDDDADEDNESRIEEPKNFKSCKRKEPQRNNKRKKPRRHSADEEFSTGLSLKEDEELALHILKNKI